MSDFAEDRGSTSSVRLMLSLYAQRPALTKSLAATYIQCKRRAAQI